MSRKINWLKAVREISSPFSQALYSCHVGAMSRARLPAPGFALQKHLATLTQQPEHNWNLWTAVSFVWGQVISRVSYLIASKCKAVWKPAICAQSSFTGETSSVKIKSLLSWHTVPEPWGDLGPSPVSSRDLVLGIWLFQKFFSLPTVTSAFLSHSLKSCWKQQAKPQLAAVKPNPHPSQTSCRLVIDASYRLSPMFGVVLNQPCVLQHTWAVPGYTRATWKISTQRAALYQHRTCEVRPASPGCWEMSAGSTLRRESVCCSGEDLSCQNLQGGDILVTPLEK